MTTTTHKPVICFVTGSAGDCGGASRVLFTNIRQLDRNRSEPLLLLPRHGPIVAELDRLGLRYRIWGSPVEPASRIAPGAVVVSFIGQMRDIKGVQDFIAAARLMADPELVFLMAGRCRDPDAIAGAYTEADLDAMIEGDACTATSATWKGWRTFTRPPISSWSRRESPSRLASSHSKRVHAASLWLRPGSATYPRLSRMASPAASSIRRLRRYCMKRYSGSKQTLRKRLGASGRNQVTSQFTQQPIDAFQNPLLALASK